MIAHLFELLYYSHLLPVPWTGIVFLSTIFFGPLFAAIWLRPTMARFLFSLLAILIGFVVDVIFSVFLGIDEPFDINAPHDPDEFPISIEFMLYGVIQVGWLVGAAISGLAISGLIGRYGFLLRPIFSIILAGAIDGLPIARANSKVTIRFMALVFLSAGALIVPPCLAFLAIEQAQIIGSVMILLCSFVLPFGVPAFIARGRLLRAWTLGIAVNLILLALQGPQVVGHPELDSSYLVFIPTLLAVPGTASRWLWIGCKWLIGTASV